MFTKKQPEKLRTYSVSAPLITTQHKYEDLVDEDLLRQLKIQAAIAQWHIGTTEPLNETIDKKKVVLEDLKARKKQQKKEKEREKSREKEREKEKERLKKQQEKDKILDLHNNGNNGNNDEENGEKEMDRERRGARKRSTSCEDMSDNIITHVSPSNSSDNLSKSGSSLIKRATLGTLARGRKSRSRSHTESPVLAASDPSGVKGNVIIHPSKLVADPDEGSGDEGVLFAKDTKSKSKSLDGNDTAQIIKTEKSKSLTEKDLSAIIAKKHAEMGPQLSPPSPSSPRSRKIFGKQKSSENIFSYTEPRSHPVSPMKPKSNPERIRPFFAHEIKHHFAFYVPPALPHDYALESTGLKGLFDTHKRLTLDAIMQMQAEQQHPSLSPQRLDIPLILLVLTNAIQQLEGLALEGIFRVSGHETELTLLRQQLNDGNFKLEKKGNNNHNHNTHNNNNHNTDNTAHHVANLLKEFLRNLKEPVIPSNLYAECMKSVEDPRLLLSIVEEKLPPINRQVLLFIVRWLQDNLLNEDTQRLTRMDAENLSIVFAGCLVVAPNHDQLAMEDILHNMQQQKKFVANLLLSV